MFDLIFGSVSGLFHKWDVVCIDNHIFRLHYRASVIILLAAIALVNTLIVHLAITHTHVCSQVTSSLIGNPINCMSDRY